MLRAVAILLVGILSFSGLVMAEETNLAESTKTTNVSSISTNSKMEDRKFYLKAIADRGFFRNSKLASENSPKKYKNHSVVNSSEFGGGYYFNDEFRGEILFHQEYNNKFSQNTRIGTVPGASATSAPSVAKFKHNLHALMLCVNMKVVDFDYGNLFLIGNLGVSQVKEKYTNRSLSGLTNENIAGTTHKNFAYGLGIGADFTLADRLHAEIAYRFSDYGQTKSLSSRRGYERGKIKLQSHNALVGLRVDM
jgi:opacity protein-like surface antigen